MGEKHYCLICGRPIESEKEDCDICSMQLAYLASFEQAYPDYVIEKRVFVENNYESSAFLYSCIDDEREYEYEDEYEEENEEELYCPCPICQGTPEKDLLFQELYERHGYADGAIGYVENHEQEEASDDTGKVIGDEDDYCFNAFSGPDRERYDYSDDDPDWIESDDYLDDYGADTEDDLYEDESIL